MFRSRKSSRVLSVAGRPAVAGIAVVGAVAAALATPAVVAQPSAPEFSFTQAQVDAGRSTFSAGCTNCHGSDLMGMDGPPLTGDLFSHWFTGQVGALYNYIFRTMPLDDPGSLSPAQAANLVAYLASASGYEPGETPLPEDLETLQEIAFPPLPE